MVDSQVVGRERSIPAWAGETRPPWRMRRRAWVYPRVGGGNISGASAFASARGLSPRGRGKLGRVFCICAWAGSIPAWAGETALNTSRCALPSVYPRVGGGNRKAKAKGKAAQGLSPRGRGKLHMPPLAQRWIGSIPAWAGETLRWRMRSRARRVYPRVGGGNSTS